jgi:hypothetical protein
MVTQEDMMGNGGASRVGKKGDEEDGGGGDCEQ